MRLTDCQERLKQVFVQETKGYFFTLEGLKTEVKKQSEEGFLLYRELELWIGPNPGRVNIFNIFQIASVDEDFAAHIGNSNRLIEASEFFADHRLSMTFRDFHLQYRDSLATLMPQLVL